MQRTYRTPKGTELPLLNLRGREYLEVKYRLVWFREDHADWAIETDLLSVTDQSAYARATIKDDKGRIIATSHKFETRKGFPDFIEKAETGAIGRALALIGYGTQFCADELDEGKRIVDAPVEPSSSRSRTSSQGSPERRAPPVNARPEAPRAEAPRSAASESSVKAAPRAEAPAERPQTEKPAAKPALSRAQAVASLAAKATVPAQRSSDNTSANTWASPSANDPGEYQVTFGKKYKGLKLREIPRNELEGYLEWLEETATKKGLPLSEEARFLKVAAGRFLHGSDGQFESSAQH